MKHRFQPGKVTWVPQGDGTNLGVVECLVCGKDYFVGDHTPEDCAAVDGIGGAIDNYEDYP
jgi:hypothetical protein